MFSWILVLAHFKHKEKYVITASIPKLLLKNQFFSLLYITLNRKNINFDDKTIKKSDFYENKKVFQINDIDVDKILVSKKEPCGTKNALKYFIGYNDNVIRPLSLRLPKMTGYTRKFSENTTTSLRVNNNNKQLLKIIIKCGKC